MLSGQFAGTFSSTPTFLTSFKNKYNEQRAINPLEKTTFLYICGMEKKCNKCQITKSCSEFGKESRAKNGYKPRCKKCTNEYYNLFYKKYADKKREYSKKYFHENKEKVISSRKNHNLNLENKKIKSANWRLKNKDVLNKKALEYVKNKIKNDENYRATRNMRKLIYRLKIEKKGKTSELLGYTIKDLKNKLGRLPNRNESLDHKIPVSWFISNEFIKEINHLENIQILTINENSKKGNRECSEVSEEYYNLVRHLIKSEFQNKIKTNGKTKSNSLEKIA